MKQLYYFLTVFLTVLCTACTSEDVSSEPVQQGKEIRLSSRVDGLSLSSGDAIGVYVATEITSPDLTIQSHGNFVDNVKYSFIDGSWVPEKVVEWMDGTQKAQLVAYYPYRLLKDAQQALVEVDTDQSTEERFKQSDVLIGRSLLDDPMGKTAEINLTHLMSKLMIKVVPGEGFSQTDLDQSDVQVRLCNVCTSGKINLSNFVFTLDSKSVNKVQTLKQKDESFTALIPAQSFKENRLFEVIIDGTSYYLKKRMDFASNKQYSFTIAVSNKTGGLDVGIEGWEDDGEDYGGEVN